MIKFVVNIYKTQLRGIGVKRQFNLAENIAIDLNRTFISSINKNIVLLLLTSSEGAKLLSLTILIMVLVMNVW